MNKQLYLELDSYVKRVAKPIDHFHTLEDVRQTLWEHIMKRFDKIALLPTAEDRKRVALKSLKNAKLDIIRKTNRKKYQMNNNSYYDSEEDLPSTSVTICNDLSLESSIAEKEFLKKFYGALQSKPESFQLVVKEIVNPSTLVKNHDGEFSDMVKKICNVYWIDDKKFMIQYNLFKKEMKNIVEKEVKKA